MYFCSLLGVLPASGWAVALLVLHVTTALRSRQATHLPIKAVSIPLACKKGMLLQLWRTRMSLQS